MPRLPDKLRRIATDGLYRDLLLGLGLRAAGAGSALLLTWLVARFFGAETFGQFQLALVTMTLLTLVSVQGLDRLVVRTASAAFSRGEDGLALGFFNKAVARQMAVSVVLLIAILTLTDLAAGGILAEPQVASHARWLAPIIVALSFIRLASALLRAKGSVLISQSLDGVAYTSLAALAIAGAVAIKAPMSPLFPAMAYGASVVAVAVIGWFFVRRTMRGVTALASTVGLSAGLYIAGFNVLASFGDWLGLFLLAAFSGSAEAGIYRVGFQFCMLFTLVNTSFAAMAGPRMAKAHANNDPQGIWRTVRSSSLIGVMIVTPLLIVLLVAAEPALALFGEEFVSGANALRVLAIAQFINVAAGPAGAALTMAGRERSVLIIELVTIVLSVAILVTFVPALGLIGAAFANAAAVVTRNVLSLAVLRNQTRAMAGPA